MKKHLVTIAAVLIVGLIAGCGGGGSSPATTTSVSGKVADGYLVGATVFLDKDGNYQLDVGEPSTTTDANGAYTLNVDPADVGKYPLLAIAIKGQTIEKIPIRRLRTVISSVCPQQLCPARSIATSSARCQLSSGKRWPPSRV